MNTFGFIPVNSKKEKYSAFCSTHSKFVSKIPFDQEKSAYRVGANGEYALFSYKQSESASNMVLFSSSDCLKWVPILNLGIDSAAMIYGKDKTIVVFSRSKLIYKSDDNGTTWSKYATNLPGNGPPGDPKIKIFGDTLYTNYSQKNGPRLFYKISMKNVNLT